MKTNTNRKNALLTFCGEQDIEAMYHVLSAIHEMDLDASGGSREMCLYADKSGNMMIGYKKELGV